VYFTRFSSDGKRILTASSEGALILWDVRSGRAVTEVAQHGGAVAAADFSPDGRLVVTGGYDRTSKIWDAEKLRLLEVLRGHTRTVVTAEFTRDGKRLLTASMDGSMALWDMPAASAPWDGLIERVACRLPVVVTAGHLQPRPRTQTICP
jgi:WD40 repeat protein